MDPILQADLIVTAHLMFMLFVLLGQVLIVAGWVMRWEWVRNFWFRLVHLASICFVAGEAVVGYECPLTTWERDLRGGKLWNLEDASFFGRMSNQILYFDLDKKVFLVLYVAFALVVLLTWVFIPPRRQPR